MMVVFARVTDVYTAFYIAYRHELPRKVVFYRVPYVDTVKESGSGII